MFYVKQKLSLFRKLGDLNNIFTTIDLRYKLKVNDTFRLINMEYYISLSEDLLLHLHQLWLIK
ncbi:MAG: hypothetical protein E6867_12105 [Staphylococcus epidermidis]|nr:hypothetical protein [Staphylococcus epidermidis]